MPIVKLVGKTIPVLTRFRDQSLGFRMMREVREIEAEAALLAITNRDGQVIRVGLEHVFVREGGPEVKAADLVPGDRLEPSWTYPPGYDLPDAAEYAPQVRGRGWDAPIVVAATAPAGSGPVYGVSVNETASYFVTFGALCRAQA